MTLDELIGLARDQHASDLHLEGGLPPAVRIRGNLKSMGEPIRPAALYEMARALIGEEQWPAFLERRSHDLSRTLHGVRCRINVLHTARGIGIAIRLLSSFQATIETLNLHPDLKGLIAHPHGLILVSGPTGSGKSSTLAALVQENTEGIAASPASPSQQPGHPASDAAAGLPQPSPKKEPRRPGRIEIEPVEGEFGKILRPPPR